MKFLGVSFVDMIMKIKITIKNVLQLIEQVIQNYELPRYSKQIGTAIMPTEQGNR